MPIKNALINAIGCGVCMYKKAVTLNSIPIQVKMQIFATKCIKICCLWRLNIHSKTGFLKDLIILQLSTILYQILEIDCKFLSWIMWIKSIEISRRRMKTFYFIS